MSKPGEVREGVEVFSRARLAVLASGAGSNLRALIEASRASDYPAEVVSVTTDRPGVGALDIADEEGIVSRTCVLGDYPDRAAWDEDLARILAEDRPDLVVSAGFLKLLGPAVLGEFPGRIINTHNSLLPAFPGIHGPRDALEYGVKIAGATVFVVDPGEDTGVILSQVAVPVEDDDNEESLLNRIQVAERVQLVDTIGVMFRQGWTVRGRRAYFGSALSK
ncbi:MAG: phosphoribosylglycinamide formyltransferase [Actinomycetaceae bacterium]|nr:phosphoribosylglycinamide formyltransferase [Actinomycetaceae bacterium]